MPDFTSNFGFQYPTILEQANVGQFKTVADATDAQFNTEFNRLAVGSTRGACAVVTAGTQVIASGAPATVQYTTVATWDTAGYFNGGSPTFVSVPAGLYQVCGSVDASYSAARSSEKLAIAVNGTATAFACRVNFNTLNTAVDPVFVSGDVYLAAPGTISLLFTWTGAAGNATLNATGFITCAQIGDP